MYKKKKRIFFNKKGMTLVELTIGLAVISIITASVAPFCIKQAHIKAADKTALEMAAIQEAARVYYINNNSWPADISTLQSGGYLNSSWVTNNPWNNSYSASSTPATFTVSTNVLGEWTETVASGIPSAVITGTQVSSTVSAPGGSIGDESWSIVGTNNITCSSSSPRDMGGMSLTVDGEGEYFVMLSLVVGLPPPIGSGHGYHNLYITVDGQVKNFSYWKGHSDHNEQMRGEGPEHVIWKGYLGPSSHLIKAQWSNTTAGTITHKPSIHGDRTLFVLKVE